MRRLFLAIVVVALTVTCASATDLEIITPRDQLLTRDDFLVVIGRARRGQRLNWSVRREGTTRTDTVTADWGNLFEIIILLDPGLNRIRVEDTTLEVFFDAGEIPPPERFSPQFVHAADLARCEDCHDPRHVELLDGGYPWVCLGCHVVVSANPANTEDAVHDPHFRVAVADCGRCHEPHVSKNPKLLRTSTTELCASCHPERAKQPATHPPGEERQCSACHDPHFSGFPAALHQPQPGVCQQCHDQGLGTTEPHPAMLRDNSCSSCHDPHDASLRAPPEKLCLRCHVGTITRGHARQLLDCSTCHDSHGGLQGGMLKPGTDQACRSCHTVPVPGVTEHAALDEGCDACHQPHRNDDRKLARASCSGCHDLAGERELASLHGNLDLSPATCGNCHPPHTSQFDHLLRGNLHQPLAQGNCSACHGGGVDRSVMVEEPAGRCRMCHDFEKRRRASGDRLHQPLLAGQCTACHDPHMSTQPAFLRARESQVCRECHVVPGAGEGRTLHPPAETCSTCHDPHGGANPWFLPTTGATVCFACHDDPRDGLAELHPALDEGCGACHDPHAGVLPGYLRGKDEPDTCGECHELPSRGGGRQPHTATTACSGCHQPHGGEQVPYLRATPDVLCAGCHTDMIELPGQRHPPAEKGCGTCHDAHGGFGGANLTTPQAELCLQCHDDPAAGVAHPHTPTTDDCSGCHDPHAATQAPLLRATGNALCRRCHDFTPRDARGVLHEAADDCTNCHSGGSHSFDTPGGLETQGPELCLKCHDDPAASREPVHPALEEGCLVCHSPHAGPAPGMVIGTWAGAPCVQCHDDPRTGRAQVHAPVATGCTACHQPHTSGNDHFLRNPGNRLCRECHQEEHRHVLDPELGYKYPGADGFPVDGGEYACIGCHDPHAAESGALYLGPDGVLCRRCHKV